jgi:hypothetical protein
MRARAVRSRAARVALLCLGLVGAIGTEAQAEEGGTSIAELTQERLNPLATAYNLQGTMSFGFARHQDVQPTFTLQPLIPLPLTEDWRLVTRTDLSIIDLPGPDGVTGLGDLTTSLFLTPTRTGKWVWGAGPIFQFPTATNEALGTGKWSAGPTGVLVYVDGPWLNGILVSHLWSFAGQSDREDVSLTTIELKFSYQFSNGWYVQTNPVMTYDWKAPAGEGWTIPVGFDVGKVFQVGSMGITLQLGAYYNAKKPPGTADWTLETSVTLTF